MSILTTSTVVSHRYYMKKTRAHIIERIGELERINLLPRTPSSNLWKLQKHELAKRAMELHAKLPS